MWVASGEGTKTMALACSKVVGTRRILVDWPPEVEGREAEWGEGVREDVDDEIETWRLWRACA